MTATAKLKWTKLDSDQEFAALFTNAQVRVATTERPDWGEYNGADMFWYLSDGRVLSMKVTIESTGYCDTCGGSTAEVTYSLLESE